MREYRKLQNVFKFDEKFRTIVGMNEPYNSLKGLNWVGTEKVDGTNIRIHWDGHRVEIAGRTDKAQFQGNLLPYLEGMFKTQEMEYVFEQMFGEKDVIIFGEGYGPKIQTGGGLYSDKPNFIVFDIDIDGHHLKREDVCDICLKMGLDVVPVVFYGNLDHAIKFVSSHPMSTLGGGKHEMEGLVLELDGVELYDAKGERIKCKCKYRDLRKGE